MTPHRLARATGLTQSRITEVIHGKRRITTDTVLRLSKELELSERFWMNGKAERGVQR